MKSRLLFFVIFLFFFTLMVTPFESNGHSTDIYVVPTNCLSRNLHYNKHILWKEIEKMKSRLLFFVIFLFFFTLMVTPFESNGHSTDIYVVQMSDENPIVRRAAAEQLVGVSHDHVETVLPLLIKALKDEDKYVRRYTAMALSTMGKPAVDAIPALIEALKDEDATVRSKSAEILGRLGKSQAQDVVPALIAALKDEKPWVRSKVVTALGWLGESAHEAVPILIAALQDENRRCRFHRP